MRRHRINRSAAAASQHDSRISLERDPDTQKPGAWRSLRSLCSGVGQGRSGSKSYRSRSTSVGSPNYIGMNDKISKREVVMLAAAIALPTIALIGAAVYGAMWLFGGI